MSCCTFLVSAPFFVDCISEQDLDEMNIEIIRNTLYKAYLEAFFNFCKELGGTTADVMCEILAVSNIWQPYVGGERTAEMREQLTLFHNIPNLKYPLKLAT
jgi:hypothetical protein